VATSDPQVDSWFEEFELLVQQVDRWFRRATRSFEAPSNAGCRMVAGYMMGFRHPVEDKTPDSRKQAIKYGKLFLHHIAPEYRQIEAMVSLASRGQPFGNWIEEYREMLFRIEETRRHIEALLLALSPDRDAKRDPIRTIASAAQQAWAEVNDGRSPISPNPEHPLCRFVVPALTAIGQQRSAAEVSEILRGRRRKPKDGQNR
jgi:hypothetical protein